MIAPEGTQHNSSIAPRVLRGIPFSQASPSPLRAISAWRRGGLYAAALSALSPLSQPPLVSSWEFPHLDKLYHSLGCGGLPRSLACALRLGYPFGSPTTLCVSGHVLTTSQGALTESHRAFGTGRGDGSHRHFLGCHCSEYGGRHVATHGTSLANTAVPKRPTVKGERIVCHGRSTVIHAALKWSVMNSQSVRHAMNIFAPIV
jgi:hypothetical protein